MGYRIYAVLTDGRTVKFRASDAATSFEAIALIQRKLEEVEVSAETVTKLRVEPLKGSTRDFELRDPRPKGAKFENDPSEGRKEFPRAPHKSRGRARS